MKSEKMNYAGLGLGLFVLFQLAFWILPWKFRNKTANYPAGPRSLGLLGTPFTLRRLQTQTDQELTRLARRWNHCCLLWLCQYPILIVNKPQTVKDLLVDVLHPATHHDSHYFSHPS